MIKKTLLSLNLIVSVEEDTEKPHNLKKFRFLGGPITNGTADMDQTLLRAGKLSSAKLGNNIMELARDSYEKAME